MRVLHICNLPLPEKHPDFGRMILHPGRWVLNLALAQRAAGMDARLLVQVPGATCDYATAVEGVPVDFVAAPGRLRAATLFYFDVRRIVRAAQGLQPDIVHAHGTEEANLLAALASGFPCLVTVQGLIGLINERLKPGLLSRYRITGCTEAMALRRVGHAIAKSAYIAGELGRRYPRLTIHEIPNTFDPRLLDISLNRDRENAIAFVGTIDQRKGVHLIADAVEILLEMEKSRSGSPSWANFFLHVFGDRKCSGNAYEEEQKSRLHALLGGRVVFHGTVPAIEVADSLSRAKALVAPSLEEMFGNQLIEALLVGTHGIVTDQTAMAENVRRFGNGTIVTQEDPSALADAIAAVMGDRKLETGNLKSETEPLASGSLLGSLPHAALSATGAGAREAKLKAERSSPLQSSSLKPQVSVFTTPAESARQRIIDFMGPAVVAKAHRELYEKILKER